MSAKHTIPNPAQPGRPLKPVKLLTDRAKRMRSNHPDVRPPDPRVCVFCGHKSDNQRTVFVGHLDGNESHIRPDNLAWTCRSCNNGLAILHKRIRMGKRTRQFNPSLPYDARVAAEPARDWREWVQLLYILRGYQPAKTKKGIDEREAMRRIQATPPARRSQFAQRIWEERRSRGTHVKWGWDPSAVPF